MAMIIHNNLFFVIHLDECDRPSAGMRYEIQLLDTDHKAVASGYVNDDTDTLVIQGKLIPLSVIDVARKQPLGKGEYVDDTGKLVTLPWLAK